MRYSEEPCLILARAWRPRPKSIRGEGTARSTRTRIATPEQTRPIAPRQVRPARWSHRRRPTPHAASGPSRLQHRPLSCPWGPETKIGPDCNFLRLAIVPNISNRESRHKNAGNWPCCGLLPPSGDEKRAPNRKKVAKMPRFLFLRRAKTGATGRTAVTG